MYKEHFFFKTNKISKLNESSLEVAYTLSNDTCNWD